MPFVGHTATRARGTVGGSLAIGDGAAEIVLVAATLGARHWFGATPARTVPWRRPISFWVPMVTALPLTRCLAEARFPVWPEPRVGVGFHEINARQSDFAFVSAAAQIALDADGRCSRAPSVSVLRPPFRCGSMRWLTKLKGNASTKARYGVRLTLALAGIEALADLHASAEYRSASP